MNGAFFINQLRDLRLLKANLEFDLVTASLNIGSN